MSFMDKNTQEKTLLLKRENPEPFSDYKSTEQLFIPKKAKVGANGREKTDLIFKPKFEKIETLAAAEEVKLKTEKKKIDRNFNKKQVCTSECINKHEINSHESCLFNWNNPSPEGSRGEIPSQINLDEKMRIFISNLKVSTKGEENREKLQRIFLEMIKNDYMRILEASKDYQKFYKALGKLFQISDLIIKEKYQGEKERKFREDVWNLVQISKITCLDSDWRLLRSQLSFMGFDKTVMGRKNSLIENFFKTVKTVKDAILWKKESKAINLVSEILIFLEFYSKNNPEEFFNDLLRGHFEKKSKNKNGYTNTIIIGDEGGAYLLLNSITAKSREEELVLENGVNEDYLNKIRNKNSKVVLGKGTFGKVRLALSIFGNQHVDIGQLICVKKSHQNNEKKNSENEKSLLEIASSTLDDFFIKNSIVSKTILIPKPFDMALCTRFFKKQTYCKGYLFMELFPALTADIVFSNKEFQEWKFQKPYILDILKVNIYLLEEKKIFNSDFKPQNTLVEPVSRTVAIIDLGNSVFIDNFELISNYEMKGQLSISKKYCPPEILNPFNYKTEIDLRKAITYLCGSTINQILVDIKLIPDLINDDEKLKLAETVKSMINFNPAARPNVHEVIKTIESIGSDEYLKQVMQEQYVGKLKNFLKTNPSLLKLSPEICDIKHKGMIEQNVVENNPKRAKKQASTHLNIELDEFFKKIGENSLFVLFGEAGSGKSLVLQLKFIEEVENWVYGKPLPIFFNMADEIELEAVIQRINGNLGCNLKLDSYGEAIHLLIDSYDEGSFHEKTRNDEPNKAKNVIESYLQKLKTWKEKKILLSCRTDFVQNETGEDDLKMFWGDDCDIKLAKKARYITPIGYKNNDINSFTTLVSDWLKRENRPYDAEALVKKIVSSGLREKMKTGLMFNMIMKMLLKGFEAASHLRTFEIYKLAIKEEYIENFRCILTNLDKKGNSVVQCSDRENSKIKLINEELLKIFGDDLPFSEKYEENEPHVIWEGLERLGELIACEMTRSHRNRITFSELDSLTRNENSREIEGEEGLRIEWKTLYQILRIMGFKLEKASNSNLNNLVCGSNMLVGFRHETYKNYYLIRALKRLLPLKVMGSRGKNNLNPEDFGDKLINAVLGEQQTINNYELMRMVGEEIKNPNDVSLRHSLRIFLESEKNIKNSSNACVAMSFLVAGSYSFCGEDLSNLNLSGAFMRGGLFSQANFKETDLSQANLRHAFLDHSRFDRCDIRNADFGVWPDLIGHAERVYCTTFSPDGKLIASCSKDSTVKVWNFATGTCEITLAGHKEDVRSVSFSLDGEKVASGGVDLEVKIWDRRSGKCLNSMKMHTDWIYSVCFSSKVLASGSRDCTIILWDYNEGKCLRILKEHTADVNNVAFSRDGLFLASASKDCKVKIWNPETGNLLQTLGGHKGIVFSACFSYDNKNIVTGSGDLTAKIWDWEKKECLRTLEGHNYDVYSVCFSPDGRRIATATDDRTIKLWDARSGECVEILEGHEGGLYSVCFSSDGRKIASSSKDKKVKVWDSSCGESVQSLEGHSGSILSSQFTSDARNIITCSGDHTIKLWDSVYGTCLKTFEGHQGAVLCHCMSDDKKRPASGSRDGTIRIWDMGSEECLKLIEKRGPIFALCFICKGESLCSSSGQDSIIEIIDSGTGELRSKFEGHRGVVYCICLSEDGERLVSGSADSTIRIWEISTGLCFKTLEGHQGCINSVSFNQEGTKIVSGGRDCTIKIWDAQKGECLKSLKAHKDSVNSVCFGQNGRIIASGSRDGTVMLWDVETGKCMHILDRHKLDVYFEYTIYSVCFSCDGKRIASGSRDSKVKIWDTENGEWIQTFEGHEGPVLCVCYSPDGETIASGSDDRTIRIWDVSNERCIKILTGHEGSVLSICFHFDGKRIISSSRDHSLRLWNSADGQCMKILKGHDADVNGICFDNDWKHVASCSDDKTLKIWDFETGNCIETFAGHSDFVNTCCFSFDGKKLASGSRDRTVKIWSFFSEGAKEVQTLEGHSHDVNSVIFNKIGTRLISGSFDKTIKVWNIEDIKKVQCVGTIEGHENWVYCCCMSPKNNIFATGSRDGTVKIWDLDDLEYSRPQKTFRGYKSYVNSLSFCKNQDALITGGGDSTVRIWRNKNGKNELNEFTKESEIDQNIPFEKNKYVLYLKLRRSEETLSCNETIFEDCFINEENDKDLSFEKVISQRGGRFKFSNKF